MLTGVSGVSKVDVSLERACATVDFDPAQTNLPALKHAVERAGFKAP